MAIFIGSWSAYFLFFLPENLDGGKLMLVEELHKFSAELTKKIAKISIEFY